MAKKRKKRFPRSWPKAADSYLYHYTRAETALTKILPNRTLRASPFVDMNDPRESKAWGFSPIGYKSGDLESQKDDDRINELRRVDAQKATELAQQSTRVLCFSQDDLMRRSSSDSEHPIGRGFANSAMWAHYAGNHSGVCLVFDATLLASAITEWYEEGDHAVRRTGWMFPGNVEYLDREHDLTFVRGSPYVFEPDVRSLRMETLSHVGRHYRELFLQKSLDWKYENEYRYVFWAEGTEPLYVPFKDALTGIVVGENFGYYSELGRLAEAGFVRAMDNQCRDLGVQQVMLWWHNGIPRVASRSRKKW
ncbi:MAG: DUF2971 domain-containing protein [Nitrosomonas sp.]|uniref:DUF2971 domain-containing protein n=1 Tax=Nitrosomonas sp. TaxID=42353 RepID=UPI001D73028B|nr:DUF2971 domain-containing protein [Nitrosomonas sp.]MBX9894500.1 DUF2971 domain-containing protein [Nitrosomonas sp.]